MTASQAVAFAAASNGVTLLAGEVACEAKDLTVNSLGLEGGLGTGTEEGPAVCRWESDCEAGLGVRFSDSVLEQDIHVGSPPVRPCLMKALPLWLGLILLMMRAMRR